jgi:YD repeat-containing protein
VNSTYSYDDQYQGTLTNITFGNSTYKYEYDDKLRLTKETKTIDGITFERRIYYDSMDRTVKENFTPGTDFNYTYNNQGKLNKITGFITSTYHNALDNIQNRTYNNNKVTQFNYDTRGRLILINTSGLQSLNYSYDATSNVIIINDTINNRLYRMSYDFLDRLVNASIPQKQTFKYFYGLIYFYRDTMFAQ